MNPKLLRQEAAMWSGFYAMAFMQPQMTPDKAYIIADRGIVGLRERMRDLSVEHRRADREDAEARGEST